MDLTREAILSLRAAAPKLDQRTRLYIASLGSTGQRRGQRGGRVKRFTALQSRIIPVVIGNRPKCNRYQPSTHRPPVRITVSRTPISACFTVSKHTEQLNSPVPSLYVLNAAALTKPHAVEQLAADVGNYQSDIAVITENL